MTGFLSFFHPLFALAAGAAAGLILLLVLHRAVESGLRSSKVLALLALSRLLRLLLLIALLYISTGFVPHLIALFLFGFLLARTGFLLFYVGIFRREDGEGG